MSLFAQNLIVSIAQLLATRIGSRRPLRYRRVQVGVGILKLGFVFQFELVVVAAQWILKIKWTGINVRLEKIRGEKAEKGWLMLF